MTRAIAATGVAAAGAALPFALEMRWRRAAQPATDAWRRLAVQPRGRTQLGISLRIPQVEAFALEVMPTLDRLLPYPFRVLRLGAYWNRIEPAPGVFRTDELDRLLERAEHAGKEIVLGLGAVKNFGYPELFVPAHRLPVPLPEGRLITGSSHPALLEGAEEQVRRLVERYRTHPSIVAWQVEHEAVDPLGAEHSWRLAESFVEREVAAVRAADPHRPVLLNGFLPTSLLVRLFQGWRTRDQGDSLQVAQRLGDTVGVDYYPRHAVLATGARSIYLDARQSPFSSRRLRHLLLSSRSSGRAIWIAEGQAEPWEAVTVAPDPRGETMYSCGPAEMIRAYDDCRRAASDVGVELGAYLFWGAEYWVRRALGGDQRYLEAFRRVLEES
jgi:hypothetical protein